MKALLQWAVVLAAIAVNCLEAYTAGAPQSKGEPWPKPAVYQTTDSTLFLSQFNFKFTVVGEDCAILRGALGRYFKLIFYPGSQLSRSKRDALKFHPEEANMAEELLELKVNVQQKCSDGDFPEHGMDESYTLYVGGSSELVSPSIWGALRGLETFSQLTYKGQNGMLLVNETKITDKPRFAWRGVLLDSSRHFLPKKVLFENLDAMAWNKLNVFHWHIVDDQSFPYQSLLFPALSEKGAYDPYTHVYTQQDVADVIEYARVRGIRVVPEFDTPGHSQSWGPGQPGLLTQCYDKSGQPNGQFGPIDPTLNTTYPFLKQFMGEIAKVFPDKYVHLGGDEVSFSCWQSNPTIKQFMTDKGFGSDYAKLEAFYMQNLLDIVGSYGSGYLVWQEVIDNGVKIKPDTIAHVWKSSLDEVKRTTGRGLQTLYSTCWYLDYIAYGRQWPKYYSCDPQNFNGTKAQKDLVIGGELCMWGEFVDATDLISRTWPRGSAVAERLWSPEDVTDHNAAAPRIEEQRCRMVRRGLNAEPINGPGHCVDEFVP
ncbi:hypothetical protein CAPTEDRAFT_183554 [Capitella teleta]|uniref:Beta-hexosaminidase n=1 Tax=Capitella teleta TaxID=283909 RepID=R7VAX7_CAPTE|nr:hypothetical protein CAPTEDRAFT_183554 [Capitella teleta]|eukprot:ELU13491.1 hypothetical protein CAPTEDRAFT_183554 [Capitella teleta]